MAPTGSPTPAWKRLGLKLRNENQSGEPVPELDESPTRKTQQVDPSRAAGPSILSENGKPLKLGKRKHQDEPAEGQGQTIKKSKKDSSNGAKSHGITGNAALAPAKEGNGQREVVPESSASDKQRPKGDPNYRKKKKGKRVDERDSDANDSHFGGFGFDQAAKPPPSPDHHDSASGAPTLLVSTETEFEPASTPLKHKNILGVNKSATSSLSPPQTDRRKSVTFTPDTKTADGNSAQNLFKKWVQEQRGVDADFTQAEVAQFAPPPKSHPANDLAGPSSTISKVTEQTKKPKKEKKTPSSAKEIKAHSPQENKFPVSSKGKKKDPSLYIAYLSQYHTNREHWKFNKAKQNDVVENALNVFRIPEEHDEALFEYIKGLKGAGVIERLKEKCNNTLQELNNADQEAETDAAVMDDSDVRKAAKEEALEERLTKEKKRRRLDGDIENLVNHPNSEGYIRRLKRARADRLLNALNLAAPIQPASNLQRTVQTDQAPIAQRIPRKRKLRTAASSDESSSSSEESSSSSESDSEDESSSESESDSDSESSASEESDSAGESSSSSESDSDSE